VMAFSGTVQISIPYTPMVLIMVLYTLVLTFVDTHLALVFIFYFIT